MLSSCLCPSLVTTQSTHTAPNVTVSLAGGQSYLLSPSAGGEETVLGHQPRILQCGSVEVHVRVLASITILPSTIQPHRQLVLVLVCGDGAHSASIRWRGTAAAARTSTIWLCYDCV